MAAENINITASLRRPLSLGGLPQPSPTSGFLNASNSVLGPSMNALTREDVHKSRPETQQLPQAPAGIPPIDGKALFSKGFLKKFSNGLEGFRHSVDTKAPRQESLPLSPRQSLGGKPLKQSGKPFLPLDSFSTLVPKSRQYLSTSTPDGEGEPLQFEFTRPIASRRGQTPSSTPARDVYMQDPESHAPVDYAVFQSLMVAQSKKERLLKEKEEAILELEERMQEMTTENESLLAELDRTKNDTKAYIQTCDKIVQTMRKDTQEYQESSKLAMANSINNLKANLPEYHSIKNELTEQMQSIEAQLEEGHHRRERIGQELLHELENSKHAADFLRDKLLTATSDLADAKARVQELEASAGQENLALQQALRLLENTRIELATSRQTGLVAQEDKRLLEDVEQQIREELDAVAKRASELEGIARQKDEDVQMKQKEVDRLTVLLTERTSEASELKSISEELAQTKNRFQAKDKELAILQEKHGVALKELERMNENVEHVKDLHRRLEEAACRVAALESRQTEHEPVCMVQKERLHQTERDLKMTEEQHNQTKLRLEKALKELESLDNRYEDFKAVSRGTKQDIENLQNQLDNAQEELKASRTNTELRLEKHLQERKALEQLLELNAQVLGKMQEELTKTKAEKIQLELQVQNNPEKAHFISQVKDLERQLSAVQDDHRSTVMSLEKQLQASASVSEELRATIEVNRKQLEDVRNQKDLLSSETIKLKEELKTTLANNQTTLASLDKMRSNHDTAIQSYAQEIASIENRLGDSERTLATTQADLHGVQLRNQLLEEQKAELARTVESKCLEIRQANDHWQLIEKKMQMLATNFSDATSSIQNAILPRDAPVPTDDGVQSRLVDELKSQLELSKQEMETLRERISELEGLSSTIVERYGSGELMEEEANLVKQVVKSTMHVNQQDLVQKTNDLKRREAMIHSLEKRVKELEQQLASRLVRKTPTGQLMTVKDVVTSSPLSVDEHVALQQVYLSGQLRNQFVTPSKPTTVDLKPTPAELAQSQSTLTHAEIHSYHRTTFARLNRSTSEDDIHQFSDHSPGLQEGKPAIVHSLRSSTRNVKRGRYEEEDVGEDVPLVTRATRRRKLSVERPVVAVSGFKKSTATRGGGRVAQIDGTVNGTVKHKGGQRGKLYR